MRSALFIVVAAALFGCQQKDLGSLLERPVDAGVLAPTCDEDAPDLECGVGVCARTAPACVDGIANTCLPLVPGVERCNGLDDDCNGIVDDGCDDDRDGWCDAALDVVGDPAICPLGPNDCDDGDAARHPGRTEICDDFIDNDCNGVADYLDFNGCTHITASFQDGDGVIVIEHGTTRLVQAVLTPPTLELARKWAVTSATPESDCARTDVVFTEPRDTIDTTERRVQILDDPRKLACEYRIELIVGGVTADSIRVRMRNTRPRVSEIAGGVMDGSTLVVVASDSLNPRLRATVPEDDDDPVVIRWAGRDADMLNCAAPCEGAEMRFARRPDPGTYLFDLRARDAFDGVEQNRQLRVEIRRCSWLRISGTGDGSGPALDQALGSFGAAVTRARDTNGDVCIAAGGRFTLSGRRVMPSGVGINAAFNGAGHPSGARARIRLTQSGLLTFARGYTGTLRNLIVEAVGARTLVEAIEASPTLQGVELVLPEGVDNRGLVVEGGDAGANVRMLSSRVRTDGAQEGATGILVRGDAGGTARLTWNGDSDVEIAACRGTCRGIAVLGRADVSLLGDVVDVETYGAGGHAIGVDIAAEGARRPTGEIRGLTRVTGRTRNGAPGDVTIGVRLERTRDLTIAQNGVVGGTWQIAGRRLSAGIADGEVLRDGTIVLGASTNLAIVNNRQIVAGRALYAWTDRACADPIAAREGTDVAAGILLVGTSTATIRANGSNSTADTAVFGGASTSVWDPSDRALPPAAPGIWTVATSDVRIEGNEVRAGVLSTQADCPPAVRPWVAAIRDGLAPFVVPSLASRRLRIERNGVVTGRRGNFQTVPGTDAVGARLVVLGGRDPYLANNYLAATRGVDLVGVYAHGVERLELWNNVVEIEALDADGVAVDKRGLVFDAVRPGSVTLVNNVILVREDGADTADPTTIHERSNGAVEALARLENNLLFVESAERGGGGTYVRIEDGPRYTREGFSEFEARVGGLANLILPPLFQSHGLEHRRSITRLSPRSPARDAGRTEGAPAVDRFDNARPQGSSVDIGHHEFGP